MDSQPFAIGDRVKWSDTKDALPAYTLERGTVVAVHPRNPRYIKVHWDSDKANGQGPDEWWRSAQTVVRAGQGTP